MENDRKTLARAIQNAIDAGWRPNKSTDDFTLTMVAGTDLFEFKANGYKKVWSLNDVIFDHEFAKALWPGPSKVSRWWLSDKTGKTEGENIPAWQYHLQQMVIAPDPIKYLEENM